MTVVVVAAARVRKGKEGGGNGVGGSFRKCSSAEDTPPSPVRASERSDK